ncbi:MAG: hypothetical protein RLY87_1400 [Chloroflexota bacterium]
MDSNFLTTMTPLLIQQIVVISIGTLVFVLVVVLFVRVRRQIRTDKGIAQAQGDTDIALRGIKSRLNYTAQLLNNERERASYDRVRFSDTDAGSIAAALHEAEEQYNHCSQRLEQALRALPKTPDEASYRGLLGIVEQLTPLIPPIEEALQRGIQLRSRLEAKLTALTQHIDQARKAHTTLAHRLNALGVTVHTMLMPADKHLVLAQTAMAAHRYDDIEPETARAMAIYEALGDVLTQLVDIRNGISSGRQAAEKAAVQGYDVRESRELFVTASSRIDAALASLIAADLVAAREHLQYAEQTRSTAVERGGSLPALQQRHGERIAALQHQNTQFEGQRAQAYASFQELVRIGLAPDSDMRHTGSEAEVHAATAFVTTAHAQYLNARQPHRHNDIADAIHTAERTQRRAQTMYACIIQRADDSNRLELLARQEYAECEDLVHILGTQRSAGLVIDATTQQELDEAFALAHHAADAMPFDGLACFHAARAFNKRITPIIRLTTPELATLVSERSDRARAMLQCQMNMVEQFLILYPLSVAADIERGVQSIRHEVNAFDASFHTASDMTNPLQSELYRLLQRYDRLNNALQHLQTQLTQSMQRFLHDLEQTSGLVRVLMSRLLHTKDEEAYRIALARLLELDEHWQSRTMPRPKIHLGVSDIIAHLPPSEPKPVREWTPAPFLALRAWGKAGDFVPNDIPGWPDLRNTHPLW